MMQSRISLKRKPYGIFYGWWIVAASFMLTLYTSGIVTYGFTAIFEPVYNEFGWSYAQISWKTPLDTRQLAGG